MCCDSMPTRGEHRVILRCYSHNFSLKNVKKKQNKNNGYTWKIQLWAHQREILSIFPKRGCWWKSISEYFLWLFFFSMQKNAIFLWQIFFGKKFCCFFLTKTHLFCKSIQASCLCSNIYCNQFFTRTSYFFSLFSFGSSLKIPQIPVLSNIFSSSEMLLLRKLFILLVFF